MCRRPIAHAAGPESQMQRPGGRPNVYLIASSRSSWTLVHSMWTPAIVNNSVLLPRSSLLYLSDRPPRLSPHPRIGLEQIASGTRLPRALRCSLHPNVESRRRALSRLSTRDWGLRVWSATDERYVIGALVHHSLTGPRRQHRSALRSEAGLVSHGATAEATQDGHRRQQVRR